MTRRRFLGATAAVAAGAAGTGFYAWRIEPHWLEIVQRPMPVAKLPPAWSGRSLVHLSDLHIGPRVSNAFLMETFDRVRDLAPDVVAYTGDFSTYEPGNHARLRRMCDHLPHGRLSTIATLGNHDYALGWQDRAAGDATAAMLENVGITVLRNSVADCEGLQFVGLDDLWAQQFRPRAAMTALDPMRCAVALSHNPDTVDRPGWDLFRGWILAGHTHGGQCRPPFLPPPILPVRNRRYTAGAFALTGDRHLYVSRGVGHLARVRFNVRPEVTLFHLAPA